MKTPKDMLVGTIHKSNRSGDFSIIEYNGSASVTVKFVLTGTITTATSHSVRNGCVKDNLSPSVFGVGFIGCGKYKAHENGKPTKCYQAWRNMFNRCYNKSRDKTHPSYIGCTVHKDWHNYQAFAEWYNKNYIDGYHLDKDLLSDDGKIYSESTCSFLSPEENIELARAKTHGIKLCNGLVVEVYNLSKLCKEFNIDYDEIRSAIV